MAETLKKWEEISRSYRVYIKLEKRLSENTVESYMRDLRQFAHFILRFYDVPPRKVEAPMIERYLALLYDQGREKTSQARALSGIRSFYNYLMLTDVIDSTPTQFIDTPKFGRHLPDILTVEEIDRIVAAVDTSTVKGRRDARSPLFVRAARFGAHLAAVGRPFLRRRVYPRDGQGRQTAPRTGQRGGS